MIIVIIFFSWMNTHDFQLLSTNTFAERQYDAGVLPLTNVEPKQATLHSLALWNKFPHHEIRWYF